MLGDPIPLGFVRVRCAHPRDHWEPRVACGSEIVHEADGTLLVPKEHAAALQKGGYIVISE